MKKEKKIKTELDHLKSIDSSLLTIALLLMCIIAIVAIATVGIYSNVDITANAAAENLLEIPVYEDNKNVNYNINTVNLEYNKTYTIKGYYGGESVESSAGATTFELNAVPEENTETGIEVLKITFILPIQIDENEYQVKFNIFDKVTTNGEEIDQDETKATFYISTNLQDSELAMLNNLVIQTVTEYGASENSSEDLSAGTIVENITGGFTTFLTGTGEGIVNFFDTIFTKEEGGISILGIVALSMMGLGIATGVIKYLLSKAS